MQWIGILLLALVVIITIAGLYLNITAQAAAAGIEIQQLEDKRESARREIADMRSTLANLTSAGVMNARALDLGYERANMETAVYVVIPGYVGRQFQAAVIPAQPETEDTVILPAYQQSLWDWFFVNTFRTSTTGK